MRSLIILFGDEQGTKEICEQFNLIHIPYIKRNRYGTPLLKSIFAEVHIQAHNNIIAYVNADIILTDNLTLGIESVSQKLNNYLLIGRKWNIDLDWELKFNSDWQVNLDKLIKEKGYLADYDCKDYFVFPKHLFVDIPAFALGRGYWDTWMVSQALTNGHPVVDGSLVINAIHQNHPYTHIRGGKNEAYLGKETQLNKSLGNVTKLGNIACATWQLKPQEYQDLPTVSIVIIAHNQSKTIEKTLLSILVQNYNDYEIIIIDNGLNNQMKSILKPYKNKINYHLLKQ